MQYYVTQELNGDKVFIKALPKYDITPEKGFTNDGIKYHAYIKAKDFSEAYDKFKDLIVSYKDKLCRQNYYKCPAYSFYCISYKFESR